MAAYGYTKRVVALDGSSDASSTRTSNPVWVGDASILVASYQSLAAAASVVSFDGSLSDGFQTGLVATAAPNGDWIRYGGIAANSITTIAPGVRWLRFIRSAADSQGTVTVAYRVT